MRKYYFPIVFTITIIEFLIVIAIGIKLLPLHPQDFHFQANVPYTKHIKPEDMGHIGVIVTQWFFYILTIGVLLAVNLIIIGELARKAIEHFFKNQRRRLTN